MTPRDFVEIAQAVCFMALTVLIFLLVMAIVVRLS